MTISEFDCIVVGAGIVGTALSYALANNGRNVLLLERDLSEPDRIVGELLQPGGIKALEKIGLGGIPINQLIMALIGDCVKDIDAITNSGYVVIYGDKTVKLAYPRMQNDSAFSEWGCSFHHGKFIMKLRESCLKHKRITVLEATVNELVTNGIDDTVRGVSCTIKRNSGDAPCSEKVEYLAPLTFVADGCFSKFRREIAHNDVFVRSHFIGAILKDCPLPNPGFGHVVLAQPSPILLYQVGTHDTRVLIDVPGKVPSAGSGALKQYMLEKVLPQLPQAVQPSFKIAIEQQRLRVMPNSFLPPVQNQRRGLIMIGDAFNMRHPLTGGGMTVAFNDAVMLSELLHPSIVDDFSNHDAILNQLKIFAGKRKAHCTVINVLAQALYELFSAGENWKMGILREACFAYFELGGICADHPMGLLSGLRKSPVNLYLHFFAVAFYGMGRLLTTPIYPLDKLQISESVMRNSKDAMLIALISSLNVLCTFLTVILSLPVNIINGVLVVYSASRVILPLIWSEMRV